MSSAFRTAFYGLSLLLVYGMGMSAEASVQRPADWISYSVPVLGTHEEVIELPYTNANGPKGVLLMIPGLFQNAASFDLIPEKNVSFARYLMSRYDLKIYLLNVRGLGESGRSRELSIDDFAIDDIPAAIDWVSTKERASIYVLGHSQGAIELQAAMAGLSHCGWGNCFQSSVANARQNQVRGIALSAGSVTMASENPRNKLPLLGELGGIIQGPFGLLLDYIRVSDLVNLPWLSHFAYSRVFEFLYHRANVTAEQELALYQRTLEASWANVVLQFAEAVRLESVYARGGDRQHPRESYVSGLKNIQKPVIQVTFGLDPMAEPKPTYDTSFQFIGSTQKKFFTEAGQGHEDYFMNNLLHPTWDEPMDWLLAQ